MHSQELRSKLKPAEVPQVADVAPYTHSDVEAELLPVMMRALHALAGIWAQKQQIREGRIC